MSRGVSRLSPRRATSRAQSFIHAWQGVCCLWRTQPNVRIHAVAAMCVVLLAWGLEVSALEWVALFLAMGMVLAAEALNTAIEFAVDLASPQWQALARDAKDVAAAAVLLCSAVAVLVGAVILAPKCWTWLTGLSG